MPPVPVELYGPPHRALGHALAPREIGNGRDGVEIAQLDCLDRGAELGSDRVAHRRLACPAGAGNQ
jgi:hypothetical protein